MTSSVVGCEFIPNADAQAIVDSIRRRGLRTVWHLTRLSQLLSILRLRAVASRTQLDTLSIPYAGSSWGSTQKAQEMAGYICGSIVCPWGMSRVEPETKLLIGLSPAVLLRRGTLFAGQWSSFNDVTLQQLRETSTDLNAFDLMFPNASSNFPAPAPGEFLVPDCVPSELFRRLVVFNEDGRSAVMECCADTILYRDVRVRDVLSIDPYRFRGNA